MCNQRVQPLDKCIHSDFGIQFLLCKVFTVKHTQHLLNMFVHPHILLVYLAVNAFCKVTRDKSCPNGHSC